MSSDICRERFSVTFVDILILDFHQTFTLNLVTIFKKGNSPVSFWVAFGRHLDSVDLICRFLMLVLICQKPRLIKEHI